MAVWVYKREEDGKITESLIDPRSLQNHLNSGYTVDKDSLIKKKSLKPKKLKFTDDDKD